MSKEVKISQKEFEAYSWMNDVLSDMEDLSLEWDGPYGKHWSSYIDEEARNAALDRYDADLNAWVLNYRKEQEELRLAKIAKKEYIQSLKTLGGQFTILSTLKS